LLFAVANYASSMPTNMSDMRKGRVKIHLPEMSHAIVRRGSLPEGSVTGAERIPCSCSVTCYKTHKGMFRCG